MLINFERGVNTMTKMVTNLDTGTIYLFTAKTAYEAMSKMKYTLNIGGKCDSSINKTVSGNTLYLDYRGETYAAIID